MARFIVTGTPRTATGYASVFFKALNLPCTHERIFRPRGTLADVLEWYAHKDSGESSWLAWAFLGLLPGPVPILHSTRNPWAVIDSLAHRNDLIPKEARVDRGKTLYRETISAYCPEVGKFEKPLDRSVAFIIAWNKLITSAAAHYECPYLRYRVEDMDGPQAKRLLEHVDVYRDSYEIDNAIVNVPRNVNAGKRLAYHMEVVHPELREIVQKILPESDGIIDRLVTPDEPRTPDELEDGLDPRLRDALYALAEEQGYERTMTAEVPVTKGVMNHGVRK